MIDLKTTPHTELNHEEKGVMVKHWIMIDDVKYLFKTNYKYPDEITYTNFGEVLYSNLSRRLHFPCVTSYFATTNYYGEDCNGVLVKSFFKDESKEDSMSYGDMVYMARTRSNQFYYRSNFDNVESCIDVVKYIAKYLDKKVDLKQMRQDLVKMAIVDCFLGQSDRHQTNIEFIFDRENNMRLAPTFDNGFCLSFAHTEWQLSELLARDEMSRYLAKENNAIKEKHGRSATSTGGVMGNCNMFVISKPKGFMENMDNSFIVDILKEASKDKEIRDLVENLITLDIDKELDVLNMQNDTKLPHIYQELASRIYKNRRKEFVRVYEKNKKKFAKLNLTTDLKQIEDPISKAEQKLIEQLGLDLKPEIVSNGKKIDISSNKDTDDGMLQ